MSQVHTDKYKYNKKIHELTSRQLGPGTCSTVIQLLTVCIGAITDSIYDI